MVKLLDEGMYNYAGVIKEKYGIDIVPMSGAGAAGGAICMLLQLSLFLN